MPTEIQLTLSAARTEFLVGENIDVKIGLKNVSRAPVNAPDTNAPSAFEFYLRSTTDGKLVQSLSLSAAAAERSSDPVPTPPSPTVRLEPGAALAYEDNVADYAVAPLAPGDYRLSVAWSAPAGLIESNPVALAIRPPKIGSMAAVFSAGGLNHVASHSQAKGTAVLQREGMQRNPGDGIWQRRVEVEPPNAVSNVAAAIELNAPEGVWWFAWQQGEAVGAGVAQNKTLFASVGPESFGLKSTRLLPVGWQTSGETAAFAALGLDSQNRIALAVGEFQAGGKVAVKTIPLALTSLPDHWAVQHRLKDGKVCLDVVVAVREGTAVRLSRQSVMPSGETAEPAVELVSRPEVLSALALSPVAGSEPGAVDALFGPTGADGHMTYLRLPLGGGAPIAEWSFLPPDDANKARPSVWAIPSAPVPDPVVFAKLGRHLLTRRMAADAKWIVLEPQAPAAEHLRLEATEGQVWAIWSDQATGAHYILVP